MTATATVKSDIITGVSSYTTNVLSVGSYYELSCDINITANSAHLVTLVISRTDANSVLFPLFETTLGLGQTSIDIGTSYGYAVCRAFGDGIQFDITAAGGGASITGTFSLKGKG